MKISKILLSASLGLCAMCAQAQEATEYVYVPNWYIQGAIGGQETLGETSFGKLLAPNAQVGVGYNFNPIFGARLIVNSWQSKASITIDDVVSRWKWNYIAPTVNATVDVTNLLWGYDPTRLVSVGVFAGVGMNFGFDNGEANSVNKRLSASYGGNYNVLQNVWDGTKMRFVGQFGVNLDFNVTDRVKVGLELQANVLPDGYNSKKAGNADWYFNGLASVKYAFGPTYTTRVKKHNCGQPQVVEKIVEKIVEVPVKVVEVQEAPCPQQSFRRDVFFKIGRAIITKDEMYKVGEIYNFLKDHPEAKVTVTGYADKGTGSMALNLRLSKQRADAVADALVKKYGVDRSRITVKSMGEEEDQPYPDPIQNRVTIMIAE